jgi:hypothetical protein
MRQPDGPQMTVQYGAGKVICMMDDQGKNTGTTNNFDYLLLFHGNSGYANVRHCYIIRILPFL